MEHAQRRVAFLHEYRKMMPVGAPILISFFTRREQSNFFFIPYRVARVARQLARSTSRLNGATRWMVRSIITSRAMESRRMQGRWVWCFINVPMAAAFPSAT